jgi:hypothetical protein
VKFQHDQFNLLQMDIYINKYLFFRLFLYHFNVYPILIHPLDYFIDPFIILSFDFFDNFPFYHSFFTFHYFTKCDCILIFDYFTESNVDDYFFDYLR